ncbi:MAG: S8 family serine peptidase [Litoreibacter sp.]
MKREYQVKDRLIELQVDESTVAVRFKEQTPKSVRASATNAPNVGKYGNRQELAHENFVLLPLIGPESGPTRFAAAAATINAQSSVERVAQVFRQGSKKLVATDRLIVGFAAKASGIENILQKFGLRTLEQFGQNEFLLQTPANVDPIDVVNALAEEASVEYSEPDFVMIGKHIARRSASSHITTQLSPLSFGATTDPLTAEQYAIFITEADLAWNTATGSPDIKIAILDEGIESSHPDLADAIVGAYDATDDDAWQEPETWDAHGTACAGLAAAIHWNGEGIRGVGGGCGIMAVRIAYSEAPNGNWITTTNWIRRAIDWSTENGADVLSNSWGGGSYNQSIVQAFERARIHGRDGKGAVVVVAAGNDSSPVDFPGNLPDVLTVSASNEFDEFKTKTSQDGETWWGSNFGPEIDVSAPGVHNVTTDITGNGGYSDTDYTDFNGTFSATPIVAGACGLLLSIDGDLIENEIRGILRDTADKVGQYSYDGERNDQMGHGRINVRRAVAKISSLNESSPFSGS